MMLEQLVGTSVGGAAAFELTDNQVLWTLRAPLGGIGSKAA